MPGNLFGYEPPVLPSYIAQYYDYVNGDEVGYDPTNWDNKGEVNIDTLWEAIKADSDEETEGLVEMWRRLGVLLESTRSNVEQYALSLQQAWGGDAAESFLRRVGGALYSLDQWQETADTNSRAMQRVSDKIESTQRSMRDIWNRYIPDLESAQNTYADRSDDNLLQQGGSAIGDFFGGAPEKPEEVRERYTNEAKGPMRELANMYMDEAFMLDRGTSYAGPTTARQPVMPTMPGRGGGPGGVPQIPAPALPNLPFPDLPPRPDFAAELQGLPGMPALPPMPGGGLPPGGVPPVPGGGLPPMPGMPILPGGMPRPPTLPPGTRPPAFPNRPTLPGGGAPMPPRPTLPGTSNRTGMPGRPGTTAPPGAPRRPNLSGTSARGTMPARPSMPGTGGNMPPGRSAPPRLDGRRAVPPAGGQPGARGGPGAPGGRMPPGRGSGGIPPQLAGRREPGLGGPGDPRRRIVRRGLPGTLGGRTAGAGSGTAGSSGPRPQLSGRRQGDVRGTGGAGAPGRRRTKRDDERLHTTDLISDEELWAVEQAGPPVVDTPEPPPPPTPGTALGRGQ